MKIVSRTIASLMFLVLVITALPLAAQEVIASGLNNPRGLKFGPDGNLYVAEGGQGGTDSTIGQCDQVVAPVGPYTSGKTAHISKINSNGVRTIVVDNLPHATFGGSDAQLERGIAHLQEQIRLHPVDLPPPPPSPDKSLK